ncbi:MAG: hypothetical protein DHS20C11_01190 [Lysobacteraceae bacterium]|nr:MAG: hypothetical protein DHS20C11_01190 [Xanthomonadaceae bacterium]
MAVLVTITYMVTQHQPDTASEKLTATDDPVIAQLSRLLEVRTFRASDRSRKLLSFMVHAARAQPTEPLTQRLLAHEVLARGADFDPANDAIVRIEVGKLRRALDAYYLSAGMLDPVVITIPKGRYQPSFHIRSKAAPPASAMSAAGPTGVAVLPFADHSEHQSEAWLADGLREELIQILTRIPELRVVSRHAIEPHVDSTPDLDAMGKMGVRFFLEGSVRRDGSNLRVNARLYDHFLHRECWADRFDRDLDTAGLLDLQTTIAQQVISQSADIFTGVLGRNLRSELGASADSDFRVYESILRFHHYLHKTSAPSYAQARASLERAVELEPENPLVLSMLGDLRRAAWAFGYTDEASQLRSVVALQQKALELAPECAPCRISYGFTLLQQRKLEQLRGIADAIINDQTTPASYRADAAVLLGFAGDWDRACGLLRELLQTMDGHPAYFDYPMVFKAVRDRQYHEALDLARQLKPAALFWQPLMRASCMGQLGMTDHAKPELAELLKLRPDFVDHGKRFISCFIAEDELVADLIDGLRKAGLQVRATWD